MERITQDFNRLFKEYHQRSFLFARSFVHVNEVAEDIASDALIVLWERTRIEVVESPKSFLFRVIKNKALDYLKHQKIHRKLISSIDDWDGIDLQLRIDTLEKMDEEFLFFKEIQEITQRALDSLPKKTREVFVLSRQQQLSGKEIAEQLGITVKGVEYHITKTLRVLKINLKDYLNVL
ncbi:RNA polymerase sigma-70 factor [Sphingobacterium lumbrici]|uniref:RNA polymerase sigma-70 factor n=1 Tax=Sphingobacterium lumbrici TaxID=2559600 RepID=UPI00112C8469|nr:RNA polymerase sigma-70 factor [Sphingobacterium lumbrici]